MTGQKIWQFKRNLSNDVNYLASIYFLSDSQLEKNVPCVIQMPQSQICAPFRLTKMRILGRYCDQRSQYIKHKVKPQFWETEKNCESTGM